MYMLAVWPVETSIISTCFMIIPDCIYAKRIWNCIFALPSNEKYMIWTCLLSTPRNPPTLRKRLDREVQNISSVVRKIWGKDEIINFEPYSSNSSICFFWLPTRTILYIRKLIIIFGIHPFSGYYVKIRGLRFFCCLLNQLFLNSSEYSFVMFQKLFFPRATHLLQLLWPCQKGVSWLRVRETQNHLKWHKVTMTVQVCQIRYGVTVSLSLWHTDTHTHPHTRAWHYIDQPCSCSPK